jgi:hypothetical protein
MLDFGKIISDLIHVFRLFFGLYDKSKIADVKAIQLSAPARPDNSTARSQLIDFTNKTNVEVSNDMHKVEAITNMTDLSVTPEKAKQLRIREFLDLIVDQVLSQGYKNSENWELNLIHPEFAAYILTHGAGMASEYTEQKIQRLNKEKGYLYAEWYTYQALSAQCRKEFSKLVTQAGMATQVSKLPDGTYAAINRASLHEIWRQAVWADPKFADEWLVYARRTDAELDEFLLTLFTDDVQFLPSTDKPRG